MSCVAQPGLGVTVRDTGHVTALEAIAMASAPLGRPHRRKERIPPGAAARRAAATLTGTAEPTSTVIDLAAYEQAAKNRNTLRSPSPRKPRPAPFSSCATASPT